MVNIGHRLQGVKCSVPSFLSARYYLPPQTTPEGFNPGQPYVAPHIVLTDTLPCSQLLNLRTGPGAAILPKDVTRIHMRFALRLEGGHMGPRKFFRENLPRLKFHNPTIPMIVQRNDDNAGPATLSIYFREATGSATAAETPWGITSSRVMDGSIEPPAPGPGERVLTINMRGAHSEKILKDFLTKTGAVAVPISPRDEALKRKLEELEVYAEIDRARVLKEHQDYKREKRMLEQAQSEAAALKAEME